MKPIYLSGCLSKELLEAQHPLLGIMYTPDIGNVLPDGFTWAADNACFNNGESFSLDRFLAWLQSLSEMDKCLFAVAPDVVGDAIATICRSLPVLPLIREMGYKAAFVAQDGIEALSIPWDEFDAWFIGGSTEWKLSEASHILAVEAQANGKWVHMGRVNSMKRYNRAWEWGCDSVDGTFLKFGPSVNWPKLLKWVNQPDKSGCQHPSYQIPLLV